MNATCVTQFLIDITRGNLKEAYAKNREEVIAAAPLDDAMRAAVRDQDIAALWLAGANPMALLYFSRASGWTMEQYYECVTNAGLRTAGPAAQAGSAAEAGREPPQTHR